MIVKTFTASSFKRALWLLHEDLGPNAVILKTRFNNTKNNSGKSLQFVELTAFMDSTARGNKTDHKSESAISINPTFPSIQESMKNSIDDNFITAVDVEILEVVGW